MLAEEHPECLRSEPMRSTRSASQRYLTGDVGLQSFYMLRFFILTAVAILFFALGATFSSIFSTDIPSNKSLFDQSTEPQNNGAAHEAQLLLHLKEENSRLKRELQSTVKIYEKDAKYLQAAILEDHLRLFETYPRYINIRTFSPELKVSPEVADILGMTTSNISKVEKALADARLKLESIESQYFTITEQNSRKTSFEIKPFKEGQLVKSDLLDSITKTLGERRANIFLESSREILSAQFSDFGNDRLTRVEIIWGKDPSTDQIKQTFTNAEGTYSSTGPLDSLPARYRRLIKVENAAQSGPRD